MSAVCEPLFSFKERLGPLSSRAFSMAGKLPSSQGYLPFACFASQVPGILRTWTCTQVENDPFVPRPHFYSSPPFPELDEKLTYTCGGRALQKPSLGQSAAYLEAVALSPGSCGSRRYSVCEQMF